MATFYAAHGAAACPPVPAAVTSIEANRYYTDPAHSIVDPALKARNDAAVKPLNDFLGTVSTRADRYIVNADRDAAACALDWLDRWALGGAMLGEMSSNQAYYQRKWTLAGIALAYLKLKPEAAPAQRAHIESWLSQLADASLAFARSGRMPRNNHYYWTGLAVMATGVATGNRGYVDAAREIYDAALADVGDDGTLSQELGRAGRALTYHNYALAPLVVMAELAKVVNEDWYGRRQGRLDLLATRVLAGVADPSWFVARTGVQQERLHGSLLGWIEFYRLVRPDLAPQIEPLLPQRPFRYPRLGGNLTELANRHFFDQR